LAGGGKFAVLVIVSVVVLPEGLFAKIFAGLSVHVAVEIDAGAAHVKFTSAGNVEPVGVVVNVNVNVRFAGVPAVICTGPGTDCAIIKSTLVRENIIEAALPATDAVTL
jgi:hypothetical protein